MFQKLLLSTVVSVVFSFSVFAQDLVYFPLSIGQQTDYNPAFLPDDFDFYLGGPFVSNFSGGVHNDGFRIKDFANIVDNILSLNLSNISNRIGETNRVSAFTATDIFSAGYRYQDNYFHMKLSTEFYSQLDYNKGLFNLLWLGNGAFLDEKVEIQNNIEITGFNRFQIGASKRFNNELSVGINLNYLNGIAHFNTHGSSFNIYTDSKEAYDITLEGVVDIKSSGFTTELNNLPLVGRSNNPGFSADIGVDYKLDDTWRFRFAATDLGFIRWKDNVLNYSNVGNTANFSYSGIDLDILDFDFENFDFENIDVEEFFQPLIDSLENIFTFEDSFSPFGTAMPATIRASAEYYLNEYQNFGAQFTGRFINTGFQPAISLYYNHTPAKWFSYYAGYSIVSKSYLNFPMGFKILAGPFEWYFGTDNILGTFAPTKTRRTNFQTGINLIFGRKNSKNYQHFDYGVE